MFKELIKKTFYLGGHGSFKILRAVPFPPQTVLGEIIFTVLGVRSPGLIRILHGPGLKIITVGSFKLYF